jgi:enoyl-CoA hydratase
VAVVDFEVVDRTALVTINRPHVYNAIDAEVMVRLGDAWHEVRDNAEIRAAILTGTGDKAFCSGDDLATLLPLMTGAREVVDEFDRKVVAGTADIMLDPGKPVIAAVNGYAVAGGMELVQATDIRVAASHARFGLQEVKWGLFPAGGSTVRLPQQIPTAVAMELLLTGDMIDAPRASELGFVNRVVPLEKLLDEALAIAGRIAANGPLAVRAIRESVKATMGLPERDGLKLEAEFARAVFATEDAVEGPKAYVEKREPRFQGR